MPLKLEEEPLGEQFDANGYESTNAIRNMGSTFIYLLV